MTRERKILDHLTAQSIAYEYHAHAAAFTCDDVSGLGLDVDGVETKNLFLTDRGDLFFLLVTTHEKRVDLKEFARAQSLPKLSFGSPEKLMEFLGVEPGSVTILGVLNDSGNRVTLFVDEDIWRHDRIRCHPLINTATIVLARDDLARFLEDARHVPKIVKVPVRI